MIVIWTNGELARHYPRVMIKSDNAYHELVFNHDDNVVHYATSNHVVLCSDGVTCPGWEKDSQGFNCGGPIVTLAYEATDWSDHLEPNCRDVESAERMMQEAAADPEAWLTRMML